MKKQYPYSNDTNFLSKIDTLRVREQWVKITLLEYSSEVPLESIEGKITSGTLTKNGDSAVRRTCNLSCAVDAFKYDPESIKSNYSISKKIYLELGITNETDEYPGEKIIWFPQGVFFITSFAISASATGAASINLQFKDKMAQLDGTIGGTLPATVRFDTVTTMVNGVAHTNKALIYDIIMETVNHFGNEDLSNIIIDDIPRKAKRIIRWMGEESLWIYPIIDTKTNKISYDVCLTSDLDEKQTAHTPVNYNGEVIGAKEYRTNQNIGYMYEDFVYDQELTFNAGSKVTDVLDKLRDWLGNYEYFYDEQGKFHFQEIKNYLNNAQSSDIWEKIEETKDIDYLYESTQGKSVYTFDDNINLISITNTPSYENIKNDFIVEGTIDVSGVKRPCRYHLVIDSKPTITVEGYDNVLIYTDPVNKDTTITKPIIVDPKLNKGEYVWTLPEFGESGKIYGLFDEPQTYTFKKSLKGMDDFEYHYNNFVENENNLITEERTFVLNSNKTNNDDNKNYLFALLERYMGYTDNSTYKERYRDIIFTLARQLRRYSMTKEASSSTLVYYQDLYTSYSDNKDSNDPIIPRVGGLLRLLQLLFSNISDEDSLPKKDENYWPVIDISIKKLWEGVSVSSNYEEALRAARKSQCLKYLDPLQIKQRQLDILIEQYTQITNEYDAEIAFIERSGGSTSDLISKKTAIQNLINNYMSQRDICNKRLNLLYSALTAFGAGGLVAPDTYYPVDVTINIRSTSFWYYNTDNTENNYGWNELEWYQYYHTSEKDNSKTYYPDGFGPMTFIDYSLINWDDKVSDLNQTYYPSMNCNSSWYKQDYINYAQQKDLPYIDVTDTNKLNTYVPTNWRTELFLMGLRAEENGTDPGPYYQELKLNWPSTFDFKNNQLVSTSIDYINYFVGSTGVLIDSNKYKFTNKTIDGKERETANIGEEQSNDSSKASFKNGKIGEIMNFLYNYENDHYYYFFDMIDSSSPTWGEYSVKNIGRRTNVTVSDGVNCIFAPKIPDYAFVNISGLNPQEKNQVFTDLKNIAEDIIQVTDMYCNNFATGSFKQSAYEQIRYDLQQHTSYQNIVSITAIPCFYLEPNVRVTLNDHSTNTFGDYVVKSISIPLGVGSAMSVSMSKAMERI